MKKMNALPEPIEPRTLLNALDACYDEVLIYDDQYRLLYINKACERHYGFSKEEMLSIPFHDAVERYKAWSNSVLPLVYKYKTAIKQQQETYLGFHTLLIANPVFNAAGELTHVVMVNRDCCNEIPIPSSRDLDYGLGDSCPLPDDDDEANFEGVNVLEVQDLVQKMTKVTVPCLLLGESGTGKTFLAKYIHHHSARADKPFIVLSCPSIPRELFESELFGHTKGAFSGACGAREGLFAQAEGGTLLLDEVSELPLGMQAKLLHVLQEKEYRPVGGSKVCKANVRILAASNRDLKRMVEHKLFRQDLFFRLNVFDITLPPLRERKEELLDLINHYLRLYCRLYGKKLELCDSAIELMRQYQWPGNIRELKNVIERMVIMADECCLESYHLPPSFFTTGESVPEAGHVYESPRTCAARSTGVDVARLRALYQTHNSSRKLAKALGVSQSTAARLIRRHIETA